MNKTTIFLFSVLSLIVIALGLTFYDFNSTENQNITFRKKGGFVAPAVSHTSRSGAEMMFTSNPSKAKKIKIRNYYYTAELASSTQSANLNGYIRNDLSLLADNGAPKVAISGNSNNGYRRYVSDNSASQLISGISSPQALRINVRSSHSHNSGNDGIVQTGPMMGAVMNHDHIFDPLNPDKCGQDGCDAIPTFPNGWGDGITEDTEIEWVPIGDFAYPMLLLAAIYMIFIVIRKRTI